MRGVLLPISYFWDTMSKHYKIHWWAGGGGATINRYIYWDNSLKAAYLHAPDTIYTFSIPVRNNPDATIGNLGLGLFYGILHLVEAST